MQRAAGVCTGAGGSGGAVGTRCDTAGTLGLGAAVRCQSATRRDAPLSTTPPKMRSLAGLHRRP